MKLCNKIFAVLLVSCLAFSFTGYAAEPALQTGTVTIADVMYGENYVPTTVSADDTINSPSASSNITSVVLSDGTIVNAENGGVLTLVIDGIQYDILDFDSIQDRISDVEKEISNINSEISKCQTNTEIYLTNKEKTLDSINAKQAKINEDLDITATPEYKAFCEAMDDDLNTAKALAVLFDLTTRANKDEKDAYTILYKLGTVLGFKFEKAGLSQEDLDKAISIVSTALGRNFSSMDEILELRKQARSEKNWEVADKIRISLDGIGIILKDTPEGTKVELK